MSSPGQEEAHIASPDFIDHCYLSYLVPYATGLDLEQALESSGQPPSVFFSTIRQRDWLFFDETVDLYVLLRAPRVDEKTLCSYLQRLAINVEAQIVNAHAPDRDTSPATETVFSGIVDDPESPLAVAAEPADDSDDEEGQGQYLYVVWKAAVFIGRPRFRLHGVSVVFSAAARVKPEVSSDPKPQRIGYLTSREPSGLNLLESFAHDPAMGGVKPRLSALRVGSVAPLTESKELYRSINRQQSLSVRVYAAVHTRIRFSRPNTVPTSPAIIALLELDFTPYFDCETTTDRIALSVADGIVEDLNSDVDGMGLPLSCVAHDHLTFLYRLTPAQLDIVSKNPTRDLDITIDITALVEPGACVPRLRMAWTTALDFTLPVNPGFGAPKPQSLHRAHRPSQLSIGGGGGGGGGGDAQSLISPSVSRPDALPSLEAAAGRAVTEASLPDLGITMTFSAPAAPVRAGAEFAWTVLVVNRSASPAVAARKLALLAVPRRRRADARVLRPPASTAAGNAGAAVMLGGGVVSGGRTGARADKAGREEAKVADAVLDDNVVHAMQRSSLVDDTEVVCLSADTRVGPLAPGACHVVELRFLALKEGIVGVEAVRVVDLGSQEHVDVRELPLMVVERRGTS